MAVLRFVWNSKRGIPRGFFPLLVPTPNLRWGVGGMCSFESKRLAHTQGSHQNVHGHLAKAIGGREGRGPQPTLHSCGKWSQLMSTCFIPYKAIPGANFLSLRVPGGPREPKLPQQRGKFCPLLNRHFCHGESMNGPGLRAMTPRLPKI